MPTSKSKVGVVLSSSPSAIVVEVNDLKVFEALKRSLQVGRYLTIAEGNADFVVAMIREIKGQHEVVEEQIKWTFLLTCQPLGTLENGETFRRGSALLPVPMEEAFIADKSVLDRIFATTEIFNCPLAPLSMNKDIALMIDGNGFYGKHIAVVGSTGSGKSCAVTRLLHDAIGIGEAKNRHVECQKNSHVVIFDIHSEYHRAFTLAKEESFNLTVLDVDSLALPYWLMNSEELEGLFIESNEENSHNQVSQFKHAVIRNKERHNTAIPKMTYDCPAYFSIEEVHRYIENMNREIIGKLAGEFKPKLADGTLVDLREKVYSDKINDFVEPSTAKADKASNGPFAGKFDRFVSRLETTLSDKRLKFLLDPRKEDGSPFKTEDFELILKQFTGYLNRSNVTIVDLSGVPFEVMSITVSLVARLLFDFAFHYSKLQARDKKLNDVPIMVVCEEAHNYVPRNESAAYRASRKSIERIAKEGRKYGLSLMVVSQRPSEVSDTIFAQCSNFVALRPTNNEDQSYVRHLIPNNLSGITDLLPNLAQGECIVVGDAMLMPAVVQLQKPKPEPQSESVKVYGEWQADWRDVVFEKVVKRWRQE